MNQLIFFLKSLDPCDNVSVLKVVLFIKNLLNITRFVLPIGLIIFITFDFVKNTYAAEEESMKKNLNLAIKRMLFAAVSFFVPTFVNFAINTVLEANNLEKANLNIDYQTCLDITSESLTAKIKEAKANCVGDEYEWNEKTSLCVKKNTNPPASIVHSASKTIISNAGGGGTINNGKDFTYYNQCDAEWQVGNCHRSMCSSGCGVVSFAVVANQFAGKTVTPKDVRNYMCSHGKSEGAVEDYWFTNSGLLNNFNLKAEQIITRNESRQKDSKKINAVKDAVAAGKGVVLLIPGHFVAVGTNSKCTSNEVYLYEVGHQAKNGCYTIDALWDLTWNWKNRCSNGGRCGWRAAWAYSSK